MYVRFTVYESSETEEVASTGVAYDFWTIRLVKYSLTETLFEMLQARINDLLDPIKFLVLSIKSGVDQTDQVIEPPVHGGSRF